MVLHILSAIARLSAPNYSIRCYHLCYSLQARYNEKSLQKDGTQSENKYSVSDNFCCFNFITCSMHMELCMEYAADDFNYDTLIMYIAR